MWFTEALQTSDDVLRSNETWTLIDTKSTNAVGTYSVKVKNKETGAVIFAGKFKVNKFLASVNAADKNKLGFYVDHDWLMPMAIVDKNPGPYVFKLFRKGTQIREFAITVGTDGRFVRPSYSDAFTFPQHGILLPAKVMGNMEKWNLNAWKTDMFYGNTISGFAVQ